jgi:hypothetical protein
MKLINKSIAFFALVFFNLNANAQHFRTLEGDIADLKNETSFNVEFRYDSMSVGKFDNESEYIEKKKTEYNTKEAGRGDDWAKNWVSDRKREFEPKFIELFEKTGDVTIKANAKYTLIFHTTSTEPGYNAYVTRTNAEIDAEILIVLTADRSKKIAVISMTNAPGRTFSGNDYATGDRISECYAVSGKKLIKYIKN